VPLNEPSVFQAHKRRLEQEHQAVDIVALRLALDQALANLAQCATLYISERLGSQNHFPQPVRKQDEAIAQSG